MTVTHACIIPRKRVFAYRGAGWRVKGPLSRRFVEIVWTGAAAPPFLPAAPKSCATTLSRRERAPGELECLNA